ncbi:MAG: hypothetical protein IT204_17935 [Fimbriimonadaceae bacterium]|nr:hypothetical protein [Fimbriimonadaceae bacterium]
MRLAGGLLLALATTLAAGPGGGPEDPARWGVAVPPAAWYGLPSSLGSRFAEHLGRGLQRRGEVLQVRDARELAQLLAAAEPAAAELARRALAGDLTAETAAAARAVLRCNHLVASGIDPSGRLAVIELWELRTPWRLSRGAAEAAGPAELLPRADTAAAQLWERWPYEGWLEPFNGSYLRGDRFSVDLGHRHGLQPGGGLLLLADLERDEQGAWRHPVALGRLLDRGTRRSEGQLEAIWPGADPATARVAVSAPAR